MKYPQIMIHDAYDLNCQVLLKSLILIGHVKSNQLEISMCGIRKVPSRASLYLVLFRLSSVLPTVLIVKFWFRNSVAEIFDTPPHLSYCMF